MQISTYMNFAPFFTHAHTHPLHIYVIFSLIPFPLSSKNKLCFMTFCVVL